MTDTARVDRIPFHEDRRAIWRVAWTLAYAFLLVAWLMKRDAAAAWMLFAGLALGLLVLGGSALVARSRPMLAVQEDGLRLYAGQPRLGRRGDAGALAIPWSSLQAVRFMERPAARRHADEFTPTVVALCFVLRETVAGPGGQSGWLESLDGRECAGALGEHFLWSPAERSLELITAPRGGYAALTAAIAKHEPRLGDASSARREGLGGSLAYAAYDAMVAFLVLGTLALWATGQMELYAELARGLLSWGSRLVQ